MLVGSCRVEEGAGRLAGVWGDEDLVSRVSLGPHQTSELERRIPMVNNCCLVSRCQNFTMMVGRNGEPAAITWFNKPLWDSRSI
jgi:hypothetical protein